MREGYSQRLFPLGVLALTASLVLCNINANAQRRRLQTPARRVGVTELRTIDQLKDAFQRDTGKVRMVVLVSPT